MKKFITTLAIALSAALVLTACGGGDAASAGGQGGPLLVDESNFDSTALGVALAALPRDALSVAEQDSLVFMREEEKLAHDVYAQFDALYAGSTKIFGNIATSESTHTEAVRQLLERYALADPAVNLGAGLYTNATLQALYTNLVATGTTSLVAALQVGAAIEEIDMVDINAAMLLVDNPDIRLVYDNLLKGSRNHLRSFVKTLLAQGVTYVPQYMAQADYDAIVSTPTER